MSAAGDRPDLLVTVRLFAMLREKAGRDAVELRLRDGATVADAIDALAETEPLGELLRRLPVRMAVNRDYADGQTVLTAGDELALIPPVSGGSVEAVHVRVTAEPLSLDAIARAVTDPGAGAIVIFQGVTREVERLEYEAYTEMAAERIARIAEECLVAHGLRRVAVEHRVGAVELGEPSVIVAISAAHRDEAFAGAREVIDRVKAEAPVWKREHDRDQQGRWVGGTVPPGERLTHLDESGRARMVDVGAKDSTERVARARVRVRMSPAAARAVQAGDGPKGEVLGVARLAGIQAAKQTGQLIPLAHPLALTYAGVEARVDPEEGLVELTSEVRTQGRTGVEMEAMSACAVAALTVYDMVKGLEHDIEIEQLVLLEKHGGRHDYRRGPATGDDRATQTHEQQSLEPGRREQQPPAPRARPRTALITISTSKANGRGVDESGARLVDLAERLGAEVIAREVIPDDPRQIEERLRHWSQSGRCALVLTSGGTGVAEEDVTPEATAAVIDREIPGIAEAIRAASSPHTPHWMLSRALAGICGTTLIVNLPGNPRSIDQTGAALIQSLPHALDLLAGRHPH